MIEETTATVPFASLDIKCGAMHHSETEVSVIVDGVVVARLPVNTIGLSYEHQGKSLVTIGLFRADVDFKGLKYD